jgi:hypothetical protein
MPACHRANRFVVRVVLPSKHLRPKDFGAGVFNYLLSFRFVVQGVDN